MPADLALDHQLCFALHAASRRITAAYRPLLDEVGLTYPQYVVMLALWEKDGVTVSDLGDRLFLDSGTLSPLLRRLEQHGLVERRRSSQDERRVTIGLTEAGHAVRSRACDVQRAVARATGLSAADMVTLRDLATRVAAPTA